MQNHKIIFCLILIAILTFTALSASAFGLKDIVKIATGPIKPFGGKILKKSREVCLIPAPPPIFVIPYPFVFYEIGLPAPAKLYYLYGFSTTFRRYQREVTAWSLGTDIVGADDAFRMICSNGSSLPDADGIIKKIGTSCRKGQIVCE